MATIQDFEERIEKQKAELAKLEAKKKELEKKIRERNRKWRSLVTHSAGESVLSAVGCAWQELDLDACDEYEVEPLPLDDEPIERPANVDAETGEIYDPIEDEARMLGEGSN